MNLIYEIPYMLDKLAPPITKINMLVSLDFSSSCLVGNVTNPLNRFEMDVQKFPHETGKY